MKNRERYIDRVSAAIEFLERKLDAPVDLQEVCDHVFVSRFYFSRIFQNTIGETVFDYLRKRRLTEIAWALLYGKESIVDLALRYQYESQQSMTKSFRNYFGVSPAQFRKEGKDRFFYSRRRFTEQDIIRLTQQLRMRFRIVELPAMRLFGLRKHLPIHESLPVEQIRHKFLQLQKEIDCLHPEQGVFEVTVMNEDERKNFEEGELFDAFIGARVSEKEFLPEVLDEFHFPSMRYISFRGNISTDIKSLSRYYGHVFSTGLLGRKEKLADASFFHYYRPLEQKNRPMLFLLPLES